MSLPTSLRTSIAPSELELIATQQLIEIIPLVSMEKTVFISVRSHLPHLVSLKQCKHAAVPTITLSSVLRT